MNKALERQDHTVVRFSELVRLRKADHELTFLTMAMRKTLTEGALDAIEQAKLELENDLPF